MKTKRSLYQRKYFVILTTLLLFLCSGSALQTIFPYIQYLPVVFIILTFIPIVNEIFRKQLSIYNYAPVHFVIMVLFTATMNFSGLMNYFLLCCMILAAYSITVVITQKQFIEIFLRCITIITIIAIICYYIVNYSNVLASLPRLSNINGVEYATMVIYNYIPTVRERNCAIFWEPGLFASILSFAMVSEALFKKGKINWVRITIFSFGLVTANSSAGFILLVLCILLLLTKGVASDKKITLKSAIVFAAFLVTIVMVLNLDNIIINTQLKENKYVEKLLTEKLMSSTRWMAIEHNIAVFATSPVMGVGFSGAMVQMKYVADTSTSTYLLSVFGMPGILYTICIIYGVLKIKGINIYSKVLALVILLSIVNKEPHAFIMFTWCLIFYLLKLSKVSDDNKQVYSESFKNDFEDMRDRVCI